MRSALLLFMVSMAAPTGVAADHVARGDVDDVVFIDTPGGELEGPGQRVFGAASFEVGEPVGVFLTRRADALDRAPR